MLHRVFTSFYLLLLASYTSSLNKNMIANTIGKSKYNVVIKQVFWLAKAIRFIFDAIRNIIQNKTDAINNNNPLIRADSFGS